TWLDFILRTYGAATLDVRLAITPLCVVTSDDFIQALSVYSEVMLSLLDEFCIVISVSPSKLSAELYFPIFPNPQAVPGDSQEPNTVEPTVFSIPSNPLPDE